jgi:phage protein U
MFQGEVDARRLEIKTRGHARRIEFMLTLDFGNTIWLDLDELRLLTMICSEALREIDAEPETV